MPRFLTGMPLTYDSIDFVTKAITEPFTPSDLDESANQEPPLTLKPVATHLFSNYISETSTSQSSGYFSSQSSSQSAPATCKERSSKSTSLTLNQDDFFNSSEFFHSSTVEPGQLFRVGTFSRSVSSRESTSTKSNWLVKRRRRNETSLPKISRISRKSLNLSKESCGFLPEPEIDDLQDYNSAPACINMNIVNMENQEMICSRYINSVDFNPLSPVKEMLPQGNEMDLSDSCFTSPVLAKRMKIACSTKVERSNDLIRHHSTPVSSFSSNIFRDQLESAPHSPVQDVKLESIKKVPSARAISLPLYSEKVDLNDATDSKATHILPVCDRTSSGLNCVSVDTVSDMLQNKLEFKNKSGETIKHQYLIVDCRYPYEYDGGHLDGAINIYTHSDLILEIFNRVPARRPNGVSTNLGEALQNRLSNPNFTDSLDYLPVYNDYSEIVDDQPANQDTDDGVEDRSSLLFGIESPISTPADVEELHMDILQASMTYSRSRNPSIDENSSVLILPADSSKVSSSSSTVQPHLNTSLVSSTNSYHNNSAGQTIDEPGFIVIFHCEFSSQRAPSLATFLRSIDRKSNFDRYPFLYFPDIYVMKGGYSAFYKKFPHLCTPRNYTTMFDRGFKRDLALYKRLTKRVSDACLNIVRQQTISEPQSQKLTSPPVFSIGSKPIDNIAKPNCSKPIVYAPSKITLPNPHLFTDKSVDSDSSDNDSSLPNLSTDLDEVTESASLDFAEKIVRVGRMIINTTITRNSIALASNNVDLESVRNQENEPLNQRMALVDLNYSCGDKSINYDGTPILKPGLKKVKTAFLGFGCNQPESPLECVRIKRSATTAPGKPLASLDLNLLDEFYR